MEPKAMKDRSDLGWSRQQLSSLMDGAPEDGDILRACRAWRDDADARAHWHAYHLIGDVLRSEDLAHPPARDALLLAAVRMRLATEPVVFHPAAVAPAADQTRPVATANGTPAVRRRHRWLGPGAVVAGFTAVAGVLVVMRIVPPTAAEPPTPTPSVTIAQGLAPGTQPVADMRVIRDRHLDRYLAAHKGYGTSSMVAVPAVVLRSATTTAPDR